MNNTPTSHFLLPSAPAREHRLRDQTGAYQISESQGPLTVEERVAKEQRRAARRACAHDYIEGAQARRSGSPSRPPHRTLTGEELVEAQHLVHERIREGEEVYRKRLRKKCESITDLVPVRPEDHVKEW